MFKLKNMLQKLLLHSEFYAKKLAHGSGQALLALSRGGLQLELERFVAPECEEIGMGI